MMDLRVEANTFFNSLREQFDVTCPLRWQYSLSSVPMPLVESVMQYLAISLGFVDVEPDFNDPEVTPGGVDDSTLFHIACAEVVSHTADSFADRITRLHDYANSQGIVLDDWSVQLP